MEEAVWRFTLIAKDQASHEASVFAVASPRQVDPAGTQTDTDYFACRLGRQNGVSLRHGAEHN